MQHFSAKLKLAVTLDCRSETLVLRNIFYQNNQNQGHSVASRLTKLPYSLRIQNMKDFVDLTY